MAASRPALPPLSLPPALGTSILGQVRLRSELQDTNRGLMSPSAAPGAVRTYEAALKSIAPRFPDKLRSSVPPMDSDGAIFAVFGAFALLGPTSASNVTGQSAVRWNYVQPASAAVASWRVARGPRAAFGRGWSPQMGSFWSG